MLSRSVGQIQQEKNTVPDWEADSQLTCPCPHCDTPEPTGSSCLGAAGPGDGSPETHKSPQEREVGGKM